MAHVVKQRRSSGRGAISICAAGGQGVVHPAWYGPLAALYTELFSTRVRYRVAGFMPAACGVALGFDRLVMLASGALRVDQVVWTPPAEPA